MVATPAQRHLLILLGDVSLDGAALGLERCGASAASGDGRDVFTLQEQQLQFIEIDWEFPARGFAVSLSADGDHFNEAFATDANILKHFRSGLGSKLARKLRITMYEVRVR